jgi:hypothetical protein
MPLTAIDWLNCSIDVCSSRTSHLPGDSMVNSEPVANSRLMPWHKHLPGEHNCSDKVELWLNDAANLHFMQM